MLGDQLLSWWLGGANAPTELFSARSGRGLMVRKFIPNLILAVAVITVMIYFTHNWMSSAIIGSVYIVISAIRSVLAWKHSSIMLADSYVAINCGNIALINEYIKYRDIESVGIRSTPFTPFTHRVSLSVATNAEAVTVYSLKLSDALRLRDLILTKSVIGRTQET